MMLCVWWLIRRQKANGQLEINGPRPRNVWLNKVQEEANALATAVLWRSEMAGVTERSNSPLGVHDNDDEDDDDDDG